MRYQSWQKQLDLNIQNMDYKNYSLKVKIEDTLRMPKVAKVNSSSVVVPVDTIQA